MAVASLDRFQAGIAITDTPISYTPGVGMNMHFTATYHQRLANQPAAFNFSNLGPQWSGSWISYIAGGPTSGQSDATYYAPDGSQYTYGGYEQTAVQGEGTTETNTGDFQTNEAWTRATLHYRQGPERYERWLPDGTVEIYAQPAAVTATNRLFFLTSITDPQGNVTTLKYDSTAAANGEAVLTSVTDPTGSQLIFSYDTAKPLEIVKVTRSNDGRSAKFQYNSNGQLTSTTDTLGITSSFHYVVTGSGQVTSFIDTMTTPYGTSLFGSTDGPNSLEADITNPLGQTERVEYQEVLDPSLMPIDSSFPSATGLTIDTSNLNHANSFYWSRREYADGVAAGGLDTAGFYAKAEVTHWAQSDIGSIPVPLSQKRPLEGRVWFNYPGQANVDYVDVRAAGGSTSPSVTARVLDDATTQASFATYNSSGMITQSVDPEGRTTKYYYDTNNIDLLKVTQVNGGGEDVLSTMAYMFRTFLRS
jgi:YD repeat-containing protein